MTIELGNRLADLRKQHGYSQEELADKLGVSRQAISKWERGEASPDTDNLIELARIYGISLDELLGLKPSSNNQETPKEEKVNINEEKSENEDRVVITKEGLDITDDEGQHVKIGKQGVIVNDKKVEMKFEKKHAISAFISTLTTFGVVIAYIVLGMTLGLWARAWCLFLLIPVVTSFVDAIIKRKPSHFAYPVFMAFIYFLVCCWILNFQLFHILWVVFLTIPIYYGFCALFKKKDDKVVTHIEIEEPTVEEKED